MSYLLKLITAKLLGILPSSPCLLLCITDEYYEYVNGV